jgi:DNA-binding PadR family transcriptional regulator
MNARLMILGLLFESAKHGYEIQKWLETSKTDLWADVKSGSIYHALKKMEQEKLIEVQHRETVGNRSRAIYSITEVGKQTFLEMLESRWKRPLHVFPSTLYVLLTFYEHLPSTTLKSCLNTQIDLLELEIEHWNMGKKLKMEAEVLPEWGNLLFDNGLAHLEADLHLLQSLLARLKE